MKQFKATHPNKLHDYVKEKENIISTILPDLTKLSEFTKSDLNVEVYEGVEGVKTLLKDILREGKDHVIFGIDETMFQKRLGKKRIYRKNINKRECQIYLQIQNCNIQIPTRRIIQSNTNIRLRRQRRHTHMGTIFSHQNKKSSSSRLIQKILRDTMENGEEMK